MYYMRETNGHVFETDNPEYHKTAVKLTNAEGKQAVREQSKKALKPYFKRKKAVIYSVIRTVSASGMSRTIDFYAIEKDGSLRYLSGLIANVLNYPRSKTGAVKVSGCGMDMAFHVVSSTCYALGIDYKNVQSQII